MESQESDIMEAAAFKIILDDPNVDMLLQSVDWSNVTMPIPHAVNPTGELPAREQWTGQHLFDARVDTSGIHKKNFVFSGKLNCIYVNLGNVVPFQIKWDGTPNLYVRALMMFTQADHMRSPVRRCLTHKDKEDPTNSRYDHSEHVLATENANAQYLVDPVSLRHSVRVPLYLQQGCDHALICYKFMCKTSCTGGLNRCPADVIFTLEDEKGLVLGRQNVGVRICSCPKRDKEKDEANLMDTSSGKRKVKIKKEEKAAYSLHVQPDLKRVKLENSPPEMNQQSSFMVVADSPHVAQMLKTHIKHWGEVMSYELCQPGVSRTIPVNIIDDIAVLPQPYN